MKKSAMVWIGLGKVSNMIKFLKIKVDYDGGCAEVLPLEKQPFLLGECDMFKLDILKDMICSLEKMYNHQHKKTFTNDQN